MGTITETIRRGIPWVLVPLTAALALRLALEPGYLTPAFGGLIALVFGYGALLAWLCRKPAPGRIRAAVIANFLAINVGYTAIGVAMRSHPGWRADAFVFGVDRLLFRGDPQRFLAPLSTPWLSTTVMVGYLGFAAYLFYLFLSEAFTLSNATGAVQLGLMRLYGIGFSGYILLPAAGPAFDHPNLLPPIAHSAFTRVMQPWVLSHCSHVDVCPSIHAAVCAFTLVWTYHRRRWLFRAILPVSAALLLGTVYLQYHYFIDLPFGLLLGIGSAISVIHAKPPLVLRPASAAG